MSLAARGTYRARPMSREGKGRQKIADDGAAAIGDQGRGVIPDDRGEDYRPPVGCEGEMSWSMGSIASPTQKSGKQK